MGGTKVPHFGGGQTVSNRTRVYSAPEPWFWGPGFWGRYRLVPREWKHPNPEHEERGIKRLIDLIFEPRVSLTFWFGVFRSMRYSLRYSMPDRD